MRTILAVVVAVLPALLFPNDRAGAEITYPWCAQYSTKGGARNCGFNTWEQCRATVSGVGGYCDRNPMYRPVIERPPGTRKARRTYG